MKIIKKISVIFAVAAVAAFSVTAFSAFADDEISYEVDGEIVSGTKEIKVSGDYSYYIKTGNYGDEVAVLEEYSGNDTDVVIPETIDGYKVEALGNHTFADNTRIKSITIPSGLEDFGVYSFYGCTSVMEYKVDEKNEIYKSDSDGALVGIHGLSIVAYPVGRNPEKYEVPNGVVLINASAFAMCGNLKEITFPDTLESINDFAFSECTSLESVELPDSVKDIERFAFSGCESLSSIKLSNNLTTIGDAAFFKCKALTSISFPASVYEIGQAAFCATGMTSITVPSTVTSIGYSAFGYTTDMTDQIVLDENFVLQGYDNSQAQRYCSENEVTFLSLGGMEEDPVLNNAIKSNEKSMAPGTVAAICAAAVVAAAVIVFVIIKLVKKGKNSDTDGGDDDDNDDYDYDDTEEEE